MQATPRLAGPAHLEEWEDEYDTRGDPADFLNPMDYPRLTALGVIASGASCLNDIRAAMCSLAAPAWTPTAEVADAALIALKSMGYLHAQHVGDDGTVVTRITMTRRGRTHLQALLMRPLRSSLGGIGAVGTTLKIYFLPLLEAPARNDALAALLQCYRRDLRRLRRRSFGHAAYGRYAAQWIARECERLENDIAWIERVQAEQAH
jgi:hypothetical protein